MKNSLFTFAFFLILIFSVSNVTNAQWIQLGNDIDGEAADDRSGNSVSISDDGKVVAIGARNNDGNGTDAGHVRVYEFVSGNWIQTGIDLDGEDSLDLFGCSVSLNSDGTILAVGAEHNCGNATQTGQVKVYKNIGGNWTQIGIELEGETIYDRFGASVSLNSDGNVLAVGATSGGYYGRVYIYEYDGFDWIQIGNYIDGEGPNGQFGCSVDMNENGMIVVAGDYLNDGNGQDAGVVKIYEYLGGSWVQKGNDIDGEAPVDYSGFSVSINNDGNIVVIGAPYNDGNGAMAGNVRAYEYDSGIWQQIGSDINGKNGLEYCGISVSLSDDGNILAVGAYGSWESGTLKGEVRIFENDNGNWIQVGNSIYGENELDNLGDAVDLNSDGRIVTISARNNDGNVLDSECGNVRIFYYCGTHNTINESTCESYMSPSGNYTWIDSGIYRDTIPNVEGCDSVITINLEIYNSSSVTLTETFCNSYTSPSGSHIWYSSGIYYDTIPTIHGCDSILTINLTINYGSDSSLVISNCESYASPSGNYIWTNSGIYYDTLPNTSGCDSIITINLTINNSYSNISIDECDSYTSPSGNYTWTSSGTYQDTITNILGCDSIITIDLTILPLPYVNLGNDIIISEQQTVLISGGYNLINYLWNTGDTIPIIAVCGDSIGTGTHYYWLYSVGSNGCSDADTIIITVTENIGIENVINVNIISIYPNPTRGEITIEALGVEKIEVINISGQTIIEQYRKSWENKLDTYNTQDWIPNQVNNVINLSKQPKGLYFIKVTTEKGVAVGKIVLE